MASIEKRDNRNKPYRVRYWGPDGRQRSKSFARKEDARKYASSIETDKARGTYQDPSFGRITLGEFWTKWRSDTGELGTHQLSTLAKYDGIWKLYVDPALGRYPLASIRRSDVQELVVRVTKRSSAYQAAETLKLARMLLNRAVDQELIAVNRASRVKAPRVARRRPKVLTPEQIDRLAEAAGEEWRALVRLAAYGALRWSEIVGLRVEAVDFLRRQVRVETKIGEVEGRLVEGDLKTASSRRTVPLPEAVIADLAEHVRRFPPSADGLVFHLAGGQPVRRSNFYRDVWHPALRACGLEGFKLRHLRHTGASLVLEVGGNLKDVADRLGHTTTRMADELYVELYEHRGKHIADRLNDLAQRGPGVAQDGDKVGG